MVEWYNREKQRVLNGKKSEMKYIENQKLEVENSTTAYMCHQIFSIREMHKKAAAERLNDIRSYFSLRRE